LTLDGARQETAHFAPWFLPDGRHFLYAGLSTDPKKSGVYVADLASKTRKQVTIESTRTIYVAPGYLLFARDRTLMAQPFDTGNLETTGDAVPVGEQVDDTHTKYLQKPYQEDALLAAIRHLLARDRRRSNS